MLLNPAGGLRYHLRALRYGARLWQPYRWALGEWLLGWEPPEKQLVLVGPSGGYSVQPFLFERFEHVLCLEPDPVARFVFRRRLEKAPLDRTPALEFITDDRLVRHPERLVELVEQLGDTALLFTNIIGQLRVLLEVSDPEAPEFVRVREAIGRAITGRSWASFHDRVSGALTPQFDQPLVADGRLSDAEVLEVLYGGDDSPAGSNGVELLDHFTAEFFPESLPHSYFIWELDPGWFHVIEGVRSVRG
jgi:hypothetical protein